MIICSLLMHAGNKEEESPFRSKLIKFSVDPMLFGVCFVFLGFFLDTQSKQYSHFFVSNSF